MCSLTIFIWMCTHITTWYLIVAITYYLKLSDLNNTPFFPTVRISIPVTLDHDKGVGRTLFLSDGLSRESVSLIFPDSRGCSVAWVMASFCLQNQQHFISLALFPLSSLSLTLCCFSSIDKDLCRYHGSCWII